MHRNKLRTENKETFGRKTSFDGNLNSSSNFQKSKTISEEYMHSIQDLISELDKANPCFIRCLRSNEFKDPDNFDCESYSN